MDKNAILIALSQSDRTEFGKDNFSIQSIPQKIFSCVWALEGEVNNGGFSQYFFNSSRETASFAVEALKVIGASKTAQLCEEAINVAFPSGLPADPDLIRSATADFPESTEAKLSELDNQFYGYPDDLTDLLYRYVSMHPEEFGEVPHPDSV